MQRSVTDLGKPAIDLLEVNMSRYRRQFWGASSNALGEYAELARALDVLVVGAHPR